jgi:hypothetical protein
MTKIKAERVFGTQLKTGEFSQQAWESGYPEKQGWRKQSTAPAPEPMPQVLESKSKLSEIPAAESPANDQPQIDELRAKAKALKIKGAHLMGAEKLKEEIAKATSDEVKA